MPGSRVLLCCWLMQAALQAQPLFDYREAPGQALAVCAAPGGLTFAAGAGAAGPWLTLLDAAGQARWTVSPGPPGAWVHSLLLTRDGNAVLCGTVPDSSGSTDAWICQTDRYGVLMWSRSYGGPGRQEVRALVQTRDGGFAAAGMTSQPANGPADLWLLRLDAVGQLRWQQRYGGQAAEHAYSIAESADESLLLAGFQAQETPDRADPLLVRVDRNGRLIWRRALPAPGNGVLEALAETPDGRIWAAGWNWNAPHSSLDGYLACFTAAGRLLNEQHYGTGAKDALFDLVLLPGGGLGLAGRTYLSDGESRGWWLQTDAEGRVLQERVTQAGGAFLYAADLSPERGLAFAGACQDRAAQRRALVLRTDLAASFGFEPLGDPALAPPTDPSPEVYVLAAGISAFQDSTLDLRFARADAIAVAAAWRRHAPGPVRADTLTDAALTLEAWQNRLAALSRTAGPGSLVVLFVSTHGVADDAGNLFLLPHDARAPHGEQTALPLDALLGSGPRILILLDACHSGASASRILRGAAAGIPGLALIASSGEGELAYEHPDWQHGAFTRALLEAAEGAADYNQDGEIRLLELQLYLSQRVEALSGGRQHPAMPVNLLGNPVLFRYVR
ncbi:MAG: caspase family protein [Bacteroidia bacterium]|nr:caspase family protein [Bacteroidia bacterium]